MKIIFIISSGRTGTKWFRFFFDTCFNHIHSLHEPKPDLFEVGMQKIRNNWTTNDISDYIIANRKETIRWCKENNKIAYVESNPHALYVIEELQLVFPEIKFLFLIRDPREVINSLYNLSFPSSPDKQYFYNSYDHRKRICPLDYNEYYSGWDSQSRISKIAWYWSKTSRLIHEKIQQSENCLLIRYEELFVQKKGRQRQTLDKILEFIGVTNSLMCDWESIYEVLNERKNTTSFDLSPNFHSWSKEDQNNMLDITLEMRKIFKY